MIRQRGFLTGFTNTLAPQQVYLLQLDNSKPWESLQHKVVLGLSFPDGEQGTLPRLAPLGIRTIPARHWESGVGILQDGQIQTWWTTDVGAAQSLDELRDYGLGWDGYKRTVSEFKAWSTGRSCTRANDSTCSWDQTHVTSRNVGNSYELCLHPTQL